MFVARYFSNSHLVFLNFHNNMTGCDNMVSWMDMNLCNNLKNSTLVIVTSPLFDFLLKAKQVNAAIMMCVCVYVCWVFVASHAYLI